MLPRNVLRETLCLGAAGKGDGETAKWVGEQLARARARVELPALAEADTILMQDTRLQNVFTCQPQQRNMHGRVFGGFLMRSADLARCL